VPYLLTQALVEAKKLSQDASIVNISSQLGSVGRAGYSAYCASKHGLNGLTKVWAAELGEQGIRVNAVAPGWIETEMTAADLSRAAKKRRVMPDALKKEIEGKLDLRRMNTPDEVAAIVAFLLSNESSGITGRIIEMAGPSG
jgi:3-oxoacyl-[acyl-carrier protein] reductase